MNFVDYLFELNTNSSKECILYKDGSITYKEIKSQIDNFAAYLSHTIGWGNECLLLS